MFHENIEQQNTSTVEKIPYDLQRVRERVAAIRKEELSREPRKAEWQDLQPSDPIVLSKFGYKTWWDVPVWQ